MVDPIYLAALGSACTGTAGHGTYTNQTIFQKNVGGFWQKLRPY